MERRAEPPLTPPPVRVLCIALLGLLLTLVVWGVALERYPGTGGGDGLFFFRLIEAGKVSFSRYRELPLWNPYECGGVPLWDNPQSLVAAPLVLLLQPLDTSATMVVWMVAHVTTGFVGMWLLSRDVLGQSRTAAFAAATLFAFGGGLTSHAAGGHTPFAAFAFAPLALYFWRRAEGDPRHAIGLGLLYATMLYEGGVYAPALIGVMLALETPTRLTAKRRAVAVLRAGAIAAVVGFCVSAARLLPVADQLVHHKRPLGPETDMIHWSMLKAMFLDRQHPWRTEGQEYVWPEYASYVGPIVLALALAGVLLSFATETWFLVVAGVLFALMLGHFATYAPWSLLKAHVPPFVSMRVPSRFRLVFILFVAGWVGYAVDRVPRLAERWLGSGQLVRRGRLVMAGLALLGAGNAAGNASDVIDSKWTHPAPQKVVPSTRLHLGGANLAQFIEQPRQNRGRLDCWEEWVPYAGAPVWQGDVPQARATDDAAAVVYSVSRTPSSFLVDVEAKSSTTIAFNTSYARGWRTNIGTPHEQKSLLVVDVPEGHHRLRVWYWPVGLTLGFFLTAFGLFGSIFGLYVLGQRRARHDRTW